MNNTNPGGEQTPTTTPNTSQPNTGENVNKETVTEETTTKKTEETADTEKNEGTGEVQKGVPGSGTNEEGNGV